MSHPTIDFEALGGVNLDRLERALQLHATRAASPRCCGRGTSECSRRSASS